MHFDPKLEGPFSNLISLSRIVSGFFLAFDSKEYSKSRGGELK